VTGDWTLDPLYPREYEYVCTRCDRAVNPPEERSVQSLHVFPTAADAERIRNADRTLALCPACQRRAERLLGGLTWHERRPGTDRTEVPPVCGLCGTDGSPDNVIFSSDGGGVGPRRWSARLCEPCADRLGTALDEFVAEPTPYDGEWYRPPAFLRAEAAIVDHTGTDTAPVVENFEALREGDLVRVAAYQRGWRRRGLYLCVTAWVDRVRAPLREGPPRQVELRTAEHHLSYPADRTGDRWTLKNSRERPPSMEFAGTTVDVREISVIHRSDDDGSTGSGRTLSRP
jgi:hypothetical protein